MFLEIALAVLVFLILFGLVTTTDSILEIRQQRRDQGNDL